MKLVNSTFAGRASIPPELEKLQNAQRYKSFPGVKVRLSGFSVLFFSSGKFSVVGFKYPDAAAAVKMQIQHYLRSCNIYASVTLVLKNKVYSAVLDQSVFLPILARKMRLVGLYVVYEPEIYTGLRAWNGWCVLVYHTGKLVITGVKERDEAEAALLTVASMAGNHK